MLGGKKVISSPDPPSPPDWFQIDSSFSYIFINAELERRYSQIEVIKVQKPHTALILRG